MEARSKVHSACVQIMQGTIKEATFENMAFGIVDSILDNLGYKQNTIDTNGWLIDYWSTYNKPGFPIIEASGSMYYGNCYIKVKDNEDGD